MNKKTQELIAAGDDFLETLYTEPGGEYIRLCAQCGMCAASCPTAAQVDYSPRKMISLLRAGKQHQVLTSNAMWKCLSCYLCSERCPRGVMVPEVIHALQRTVIKYDLPMGARSMPKMYQTFIDVVKRYGRNQETLMLFLFYLRTNPLAALRFISVGFNLIRRGRLEIGMPHKIKRYAQLKLMLDKARTLDGAG